MKLNFENGWLLDWIGVCLFRISIVALLSVKCATADTRSYKDNVDMLKDATFRVEDSKGNFLGTAFAVNKYGDYLTCNHVISTQNSEPDTIYLSNTIEFKSISKGDTTSEFRKLRFATSVVSGLPHIDLAVLHVDLAHYGFERMPFLPLASVDMVEEGDEIILSAYIPDIFSTPRAFISRGIVSTIRRNVYNARLQNHVDLLQLDLSAAKGTSGGPVFSTAIGRVVAFQNSGIFEEQTSTQTLYPIAISIEQVLSSLDSLGIAVDVKFK